MNYIDLITKLPFSTYILKVKITDKIDIIDLNILKHENFTGFEINEITPKLLEKNLNPVLKQFNKNLEYIKNQKIIAFSHQFTTKKNNIVFLKEILKLIEKKENTYTFLGIAFDISKEKEYSQIYETLISSPHIGLLIYKNKIIFASNKTKKIFDIDDRIYKLSPLDVFPEYIKHKIKPNIEKRLNGEFFNTYYELELPSFNQKRIFVKFFASTIIYEGSYAGAVLVIDTTNEYKKTQMLQIINNINNTIKLTFVNNRLNIDLFLNETIKAIKSSNFFHNIRLLKKNLKNDFEIKNNPHRKYKSSALFPIYVNGKIYANIKIFSIYKNDFDKTTTKTLKEINNTLNLSIQSIIDIQTLKILKTSVENSYQWIIITNEKGEIIYANDTVEKISGYNISFLLGKNPKIFKSGFHNDDFYKNMWQTILKGKPFEAVFINKSKEGKIFYLKSKIIPVKFHNKTFFLSLAMDITNERLLQNQLSDIKFKDTLTNLLNRYGFVIKASETIIQYKSNYALFVIDLKDFAAVNEIKGHKFGDILLMEFAEFLKDIFYKTDIIARIGNDEFCVFLTYKEIKSLYSVINKFLEHIKDKKFNNFTVSINIGIAVLPNDATNIEELLEKGYIALKSAKQKGENVFEFYNPSISENLETFIKIKEILTNALINNELEFFFQPYVRSENLEFGACECLLRINHNNKTILPFMFIDYAEKSGMIKEIEIIMANKLVNNIKKLNFNYSLNISGISLKDETHINKIIDITKQYSKNIIIEITERELIDNIEYTIKIFEKFKNNGYKIAIDDFGTGYSSLIYIKNIPADFIKIDINFIKNITNSEKDLAIVDTIINFAKKLKIKTIAEGVETINQVLILQKLGCDYLQGFYFSKPLPFEDLKKLLKKS